MNFNPRFDLILPYSSIVPTTFIRRSPQLAPHSTPRTYAHFHFRLAPPAWLLWSDRVGGVQILPWNNYKR